MIGTKLDHYEITTHLGSGGMGEVYQATDSTLGRRVAIKVLPEAYARDHERIARLEREARMLASLNHPNIAAIYGLEQSESRRFLVLEYVPGETLAECIGRGPIPLDEALIVAKQIAEALESAHEKGIIHRDLKPANVKITPDGRVKVLDFGLAKGIESEPASAVLSNSPTLSVAATNAGVILGTAAYMSPEQAKGRQLDRRTDIFAFGCVLYEMLTGKPAFDGEDVPDILSSVLKTEPDWSRLPATVPDSVRRLLRLCLRKDLKTRRDSATDVRIDLEEAMTENRDVPASVAAGSRSATVAWIIAIVATVAAIVTMAIALQPIPEAAELRLDIATPTTREPYQFALSPDGNSIAFVATDGPQDRIWIRRLDTGETHALPGTEGPVQAYPFWSPDSRSIGFFADKKLKRVEVSGGASRTLAETGPGQVRGGTWNNTGTILFSVAGSGQAIVRVPDTGGKPEAVTRLKQGQGAHRFPFFLPDGKNFLFAVSGPEELGGIYISSLDGAEPKRLSRELLAAAFLAPDHMVYLRQGALVAQKLDLVRGELSGNADILATEVGADVGNRRGAFSVSNNGRVAYRGVMASGQLVWFDRSGKQLAAVERVEAERLINPELSPDGSRVAVDRTFQGARDVWLINLLRGGMTRFTFNPGLDGFPVWSPDGSRFAFESSPGGGSGFNILEKSSGNPTGPEITVLDEPGNQWPLDWSKDGKHILYYDETRGNGDLLALSMPDRKKIEIGKTSYQERSGAFSPSGQLVAYDTDASGQFEVVVQTFPDPQRQQQVSTQGGRNPRWSADGKELYFITPDHRLMATRIRVAPSSIETTAPEALFQTQIVNDAGKPQYAVSRDGRFLINTIAESAVTPITLILNWKPKQ